MTARDNNRARSDKEHKRKENEVWAPLDDRHVQACAQRGGSRLSLGLGNAQPPSASSKSSLFNKDGSPATYAFDYVFHGRTRTRDVYRAAARPAVRGAMEGTDGTVFAYGVTSSGKVRRAPPRRAPTPRCDAHSRLAGRRRRPTPCPGATGTQESSRLRSRRCSASSTRRPHASTSSASRTLKSTTKVRISAGRLATRAANRPPRTHASAAKTPRPRAPPVINDLLDPANTHLRVREEAGRGVYVEGLKEEVVLSGDHVMSLIAAGEAHRHVGSTRYNEESSRSHTIFRLWCESSPRAGNAGNSSRGSPTAPMRGDQPADGANEPSSLLGQLNLIDLAGSESSRASSSGKRQVEGGYINKSLLTLGTVISKLAEGNRRESGHVPYRDSKLTRVLQPALGGRGKVSLVCTVTPASGSAEETHNTLKFANRAKNIQVSVNLNEVLDEKSLIKRYRAEIRKLRNQLETLQSSRGDAPLLDSMEDVNALRQRVAEEHAALLEREADKLALEGRIQRLTKIILHSSRVMTVDMMDPIDAPGPRATAGASQTFEQPIKRSRSFEGERDLASLTGMLGDKAVVGSPMPEGLNEFDDGSATLRDPDMNEKENKQEVERRKGGFMAWLRGGGFTGSATPDSRAGTPMRRGNVATTPSTSGQATAEKRPASARRSRMSFGSRTPNVDNSTPGGASALLRAESPSLVGHVARQSTLAGDIQLGPAALRRDHSDANAEQIEMFRQEMRSLAREIAEKDEALAAASQNTAASQEEIKTLRQQILEKNRRMSVLEQRELGAKEHHVDPSEFAGVVDRLRVELGERNFEIQVTQADNRVLQERIAELSAAMGQLKEENEKLQQRSLGGMRQDAAAAAASVVQSEGPDLSPSHKLRDLDASGREEWEDADETIVIENGLAMEANKALQRELDLARGFGLEGLSNEKIVELEAQAQEALRRISAVREREQQEARILAEASIHEAQERRGLGWPFGDAAAK